MKDHDTDKGHPPAEISARTAFSRNRLWRDGEHRNDESFADAIAHPSATFYLTTSDGKWVCRTQAESDSPSDVSSTGGLHPAFALSHAHDMAAHMDAAVLLGFDPNGNPALAVPLAKGSDAFGGNDCAGPLTAIDLRSLGMQQALDPDTEGRLGQAAHLIGWHARNRFCARCGGATTSEAAGYRRRCTSCDDVVFPRTDPVTIMLVHDGNGRCILGRQPRFAEGFWSCLAGFVEAGETLEDAVRRETQEEAGVTVGPVSYLASQPWAFPSNLMIGCIALAQDFTIAFDSVELEACRWFERSEVVAMLDGTHPEGLSVPKPFAIAHHLIKAFADGEV